MAAPAPPQTVPGNGWTSPFGAAEMRPFDDDHDASRRSGSGNGPLPATMHQRRPSDPSLPADFGGFTLLTRRSKSVTLPSGGPASREASQHDALFASTVGDVRKEESSPTAGIGGRTWNPFKRKAAAKKAAAEDPQAKPAAPPAAPVASESSTSSRRWGRSKAPAASPATAAGVPPTASAALNIDVRDAEPPGTLTSAGPGAPLAGSSERPASAPSMVKAAAAGAQPQQAPGVIDTGEAPHDPGAGNQAGANGGARWFGRSPGKLIAQPAAAPPPRAAEVLPKASAAAKPEAAGPGPNAGRFGALFSGIQRSSMSRPATGKGRAKAADEPPSVARDSGEAAAGAELLLQLPRKANHSFSRECLSDVASV